VDSQSNEKFQQQQQWNRNFHQRNPQNQSFFVSHRNVLQEQGNRQAMNYDYNLRFASTENRRVNGGGNPWTSV